MICKSCNQELQSDIERYDSECVKCCCKRLEICQQPWVAEDEVVEDDKSDWKTLKVK